MSYRSQKTDDGDVENLSSSSEGELFSGPSHKLPRVHEQTSKQCKGSKSGHMWSAFLEEQGLTEHLSSRAEISGVQVERGVESYEAPQTRNENEPKREYNSSGGNRFHKQYNRTKTGMDADRTAHGTNGNRRKFLGKRPHSISKEPIISTNYSLEGLMSAEFPEGLTIDELGREISEAMGEPESSVIPSVVKELGEEQALKLFNEVRDIEASGGMKVLDGSRRRTPGGVYMVLFKSDPDVSQEIKKKILKLSKSSDRCVKRSKRRNKSKEVSQLPTAAEVLLKDETAVGLDNTAGEKTENLMDTSL